nr:hypothetical protein [Marinicella sp. W31]MDC2875476.1 hypothetical protein [Marinicella sp. W31]
MSFFGGGTDYPDYFQEFPGAVLGTAIDKFIYTVTLPMAGVAETRYRITYRNVETVDNVSEIKHNAIRAVLQDKQYDAPLNIAIISDLPGGSGLGSSSSFTVGFVKLISHLQGRSITKLDLMREAVRVETELLHENCGIQDQSHASFGGLNHYRFHGNDFSLQPVRMTTDCRDAVNASMCLIYTGVQRSASQTLETQISNTRERKIVKELRHLYELCEEGVRVLEGNDPQRALTDLGGLLSEGWMTKRSLRPRSPRPVSMIFTKPPCHLARMAENSAEQAVVDLCSSSRRTTSRQSCVSASAIRISSRYRLRTTAPVSFIVLRERQTSTDAYQGSVFLKQQKTKES